MLAARHDDDDDDDIKTNVSKIYSNIIIKYVLTFIFNIYNTTGRLIFDPTFK